jgi:hypothetical protein
MGAKHSLVLTDRVGHVHRWLPSCSCGQWIGVQRRRKQEALEQYRDHVAIVNGSPRSHLPKPQPVTPVDERPEALR